MPIGKKSDILDLTTCNRNYKPTRGMYARTKSIQHLTPLLFQMDSRIV